MRIGHRTQAFEQWCEQDQILKTKTGTTRPRSRPRPEWQDQDQDRAFVPRLFVQYTYCSSSEQFPLSVFKRLLYLTYSKFDITVLTISTTELHVFQDQDQDQDQTCKTKTKTKTAAYKTRTKTSFCWSETGLITRPKSQTTSLLGYAGLDEMLPHLIRWAL